MAESWLNTLHLARKSIQDEGIQDATGGAAKRGVSRGNIGLNPQRDPSTFEAPESNPSLCAMKVAPMLMLLRAKTGLFVQKVTTA